MSAGHNPFTDDELMVIRATPFNAESAPHALGQFLTPTENYFVRSNFAVPSHSGELRITGALTNPLTFSLDDLRARDAVTLTVTQECAGNGRIGLQPLPEGEPWGGYAVGTATWTGVPLADLLAEAGIDTDAATLVFHGADGGVYKGMPGVNFIRALPREYALDRSRDVLVAYAMNGEPLTPAHGAPFRLLVPGWYGMASVKWLQEVVLQREPFEGRFQTSSYLFHWADGTSTPVSTIQVNARITSPTAGSTVSEGQVVVHGKAWSGGGRTIERVEVSVDAGPWMPAELQASQSRYAWQEWSFVWDANGVARHAIRARAIDSAGNVQPDTSPWNRLGYGNNAVQPVLVNVIEG